MNTKNRGFTFVEVLIAILIMGIVGGTAMQLFGLSQMFVDRQISSAMRLNAERFTLDSIYAELHKGAIASIDILSTDNPNAATAVSDYKYIFLSNDGHVILREWSASVSTHVDRQLLGADGVQRLMFSLSNDTQTAAAAHYMLLANVIARGVTRPEEGLERTIGRRIGLGRPVKGRFGSDVVEAHNTYTGTAVRFAFFVAPDTMLTGPEGVFFTALDVGNDANNGKSWATATKSVQKAVDLAKAAYDSSGTGPADRKVQEVWVRAGKYSSLDLGPTGTLALKKGVNLYGGFSGDMFASGDRTYITTLSGDNTRRVISCDFPSSTLPANRPNSIDTIIDGFTITGGSADVGGGMYNSYASPLVRNCIFSGNMATNIVVGGMDGGGGMRNSNSDPTVTNCTFFGNTALQGGGMLNIGSSPTVTNCIFSGNYAYQAGGGIHNRMGGSPVITNCTFSENIAAGNYSSANGGGLWSFNHPLLTIINCTFADNKALGTAGGIALHTVTTTRITNTIFWGNTDVATGTAVREIAGNPTLTNCVVRGTNTNPLIVSIDSSDARATKSVDVRIYKFKGAGSAIDAGTRIAGVLSSDQRGFLRYDPGRGANGDVASVDIGAYEYNLVSGDIFYPGP